VPEKVIVKMEKVENLKPIMKKKAEPLWDKNDKNYTNNIFKA